MKTYAQICLERAEKATSATNWKSADDWYHDHRVGYPIHGSGLNDDADAKFLAHSRVDVVELARRLEKAIQYIKDNDLERDYCIDLIEELERPLSND